MECVCSAHWSLILNYGALPFSPLKYNIQLWSPSIITSLRAFKQGFWCLREFSEGFLSVWRVAWEFLKEHPASILRSPRVSRSWLRVSKGCFQCPSEFPEHFLSVRKVAWGFPKSVSSVSVSFRNVSWVSGMLPESFWKSIWEIFGEFPVSREFTRGF